jgi:hypothetical protein
MTERARRIVLQGVVIFGAVVPFALGAVSELLVPFIGKHSMTFDSINAPRDDEDLWYDFGSKSAPVDRTGIKYSLDYQRALADAKLSNRPVFLYFTTVNDANARRIHINVMRAPAVIARLRRFECAVLFVDMIPWVDPTVADRLVAQNRRFLEELIGDIQVPAFAVVHPEFDDAGGPRKRKPLAKADLWEIRNAATIVRFLDEALVKWAQSRRLAK